MNPDNYNVITKKLSIFLGLALGMLFVFSFIPFGGGGSSKQNEQANTVSTLKEIQDPFEELGLKARSVVVWDIKEGKEIFSFRKNIQWPLASLTKIMTALVVEETLPTDSIVIVDRQALFEEGDTGLLLGERWGLKDLINFTLITSSNDGARALASTAYSFHVSKTQKEEQEILAFSFEGLMNQYARKLNLHQTYFVSPSGLDVNEEVSGAYGSAQDLALLLGFTLKNHPHLLGETRYKERTLVSLDGISHQARNTNNIVETLPGVIASKTGFTELAGGNLAIIFEIAPSHPIAVVALGSTAEDRFSDIEKLIWATIEYFGTLLF